MWFLLVAEAAKENKIHPDDVRKAFQGSRSELLHQVFHFRIQHYILGKSPVCDFRPAIVSLTHWHALCSQSAAVRCIYVCVCVCCCVYVVLGFDSLPLSLLLLCTCSLSPISRFVFVCPPSEWEQLSLTASSRVYMTVAFSWGLFFLLFSWWCLGWENSRHLFYAWVKPQGKKTNIPSFKPTVTVGRHFLAWNNNPHGCFFHRLLMREGGVGFTNG